MRKTPKFFWWQVTQQSGSHDLVYTRLELQIFKYSNVTLANVFVEYFNVFLTKLYQGDYCDHLDISGCQWLSIGKSSTFDETGLWDAMVHAMENRAMELCYVLHGTLGWQLMY